MGLFISYAHTFPSRTPHALATHTLTHTHTRTHDSFLLLLFFALQGSFERVCARVNRIYIINAFARPGWPNQSGHHRRTTTDRHSLQSFEQKCAHEIAPLQRHQCLHKHLSIFFLHRVHARTQPTHARGMSIICLCSPLASQSPCRYCCCCMAPHTWLGI